MPAIHGWYFVWILYRFFLPLSRVATLPLSFEGAFRNIINHARIIIVLIEDFPFTFLVKIYHKSNPKVARKRLLMLL